MSIQQETKTKMEEALEHFKKELKGVRTGQASPAMVENVQVEAYGSMMPLHNLATINTPEPRQLVVLPFDKSTVGAIGKAIEKALGFSPVVDGDKVRVNIPPMTSELRAKMVKYCHQLLEQSKVTIRQIRQDANKFIRKQKADGDIPEDVMHKEEKKIQEITDQYTKKSEELAAAKEKELSKI